MTSKSAKIQEEKKIRVKVDRLQKSKEAMKDLPVSAAKDVKGGLLRRRLTPSEPIND